MGNVTTFRGNWRIVEAGLWDLEDLDLVTPATISLDRNHDGRIALLAIEAELDYRVIDREGLHAIEFSFDGFDEDHRTTGRGWAVLQGDRLHGRLFFHQGDESSFVAERKQKRRARNAPATACSRPASPAAEAGRVAVTSAARREWQLSTGKSKTHDED